MTNNILDVNICCGCGECKTICPKSAITMQFNSEGFLYPKIDNSLCVNCGLCLKHCSFDNVSGHKQSFNQDFYAVKHCYEKIREESRSGGVFTAFSDVVLDMGGVVYGARLFDNVVVRHCRATKKTERDFFRGVKYIQSSITDIFKQVEEDLLNGLYVLFTGTPCQVGAIKNYIDRLNLGDKLILIDIICYGVSSPMVWKDYLVFLEKLYKQKAISVNFRDKKTFGWADHKESIIFKKETFSSNLYASLFAQKKILRKDCFSCPYKSLKRVGDISIGDCWGIDKHYPEFNDNKGVSIVILNTEKGENLFKQIRNEVDYIKVDINKLMQPALIKNWEMPSDREEFWQYYNTNKFENVLIKYAGYKKPVGFFKKVKIKCKKLIKKLIRK